MASYTHVRLQGIEGFQWEKHPQEAHTKPPLGSRPPGEVSEE